MEHSEEKVTFELGVEEQGEDGDVGKKGEGRRPSELPKQRAEEQED